MSKDSSKDKSSRGGSVRPRRFQDQYDKLLNLIETRGPIVTYDLFDALDLELPTMRKYLRDMQQEHLVYISEYTKSPRQSGWHPMFAAGDFPNVESPYLSRTAAWRAGAKRALMEREARKPGRPATEECTHVIVTDYKNCTLLEKYLGILGQFHRTVAIRVLS